MKPFKTELAKLQFKRRLDKDDLNIMHGAVSTGPKCLPRCSCDEPVLSLTCTTERIRGV